MWWWCPFTAPSGVPFRSKILLTDKNLHGYHLNQISWQYSSQSKRYLYWGQLTISYIWWGRWCFASEWRKIHALPNGVQVCPGKSNPASVWPARRPSCRSWWQPPRSRSTASVSYHRYGAWGPFNLSLNSHYRLLSDAKCGHFQILWWIQIVCFILKMLVSEGYHLFKTTLLGSYLVWSSVLLAVVLFV